MASYNITEMRYASSDGKNTIYAEIYSPVSGEVKGVVQLVHGMCDYTARYTLLAEFLCANGYVFAGHHHLGHGLTASCEDDLGYFARRDGVRYLVEDVHTMTACLREIYTDLPVFVMGHSMGSFVTRLYAECYPDAADGIIIHGTGGPNRLIPMGKVLGALLRLFHGSRYRSRFITGVAFGAYNKKFPGEGQNAWLTREGELVAGKKDDKLASFNFTLSGYLDLFRLIQRSNRKGWFVGYPKDMPTVILSGDMDPVGNYGKGVQYVYDGLKNEGHNHLTMKLYHGARHELFNESNREEVFRDMLTWIEGVRK